MPAGQAVSDRVVAMRLPAPLAAKATRRVTQCASKKGKRLDPRTLEAAHFVMVFTTLPAMLLDARGLLELYRYRWQIELAFKWLKQLLKLSRLPHQSLAIAQTWILAKLVVALLLETLYRNARVFSHGGYRLEALTSAWP
jgi:IS4 transposase